MTNMLKSAVVAALLLGGSTVALAPSAFAQAAGPAVAGIGFVNLDQVIANSNAFRTAQAQRPTTYKPQFDQAQARKTQIEAQLQPLAAKFEKDRAAPGANQAALQQEVQVIQGIQQSGQQELQRIMQPVAYSQAYVNEQIEAKLDQAATTAMAKKRITLLLNPQAIVKASGTTYDLTQDILTEVNALIPSATLTPPAGWEPREVREQRAQQQAQQGAAPPAGGQPQGR